MLYQAASLQPFLLTLRKLSGPNTVTLLAHEHRERLPFLQAAGFEVEAVPEGELDPHWRSDDISVYRVRLQLQKGEEQG